MEPLPVEELGWARPNITTNGDPLNGAPGTGRTGYSGIALKDTDTGAPQYWERA